MSAIILLGLTGFRSLSYKILRIRNVRKMDKLPSKLVRLTIINTLAYYASKFITAVTNFMVKAPGVDVKIRTGGLSLFFDFCKSR